MTQTNQFVKWSSSENGMPFTHYGKLISEDEEMVSMQDTFGGTMTFPKDDGKVTFLPKLPPGFSIPEQEASTVAFIRPTKKPRVSRTGGKTKKQRAQELYDAEPNKERAVIISMFMAVLDMSKSGASTYYYNLQK